MRGVQINIISINQSRYCSSLVRGLFCVKSKDIEEGEVKYRLQPKNSYLSLSLHGLLKVYLLLSFIIVFNLSKFEFAQYIYLSQYVVIAYVLDQMMVEEVCLRFI